MMKHVTARDNIVFFGVGQRRHEVRFMSSSTDFECLGPIESHFSKNMYFGISVKSCVASFPLPNEMGPIKTDVLASDIFFNAEDWHFTQTSFRINSTRGWWKQERKGN